MNTYTNQCIIGGSSLTLSTYSERPWNESLSARIAEVQDCYKNIPPKLYFSPSSVSFEGIGVYAAEPLPQGTKLN